MITIKMIDARRGLYLKCKELFGDEKIAENIYNYLCEGIEECEECEPERKTGEWIITCEFEDCYYAKCNQCNTTQVFYFNKSLTNFCPNCSARMLRGEEE